MEQDHRRKRAVRTAWWLVGLALAFYVGFFIVEGLFRP